MTPEQQQAKATYHAWKRIIKNPPAVNDTDAISSLWTGALTILNEDDRDWKQQLPRDLDSDEYYGREHIGTLMSMKSHEKASRTFVELVQPFLFVITHQAFLDCLAVDTAVGNLYNYISGANGKRAISFFQRCSKGLVNNYLEGSNSGSTVMLEKAVIALANALRELLSREQRSQFNEDLPSLLDSIENILDIAAVHTQSEAYGIVNNRLVELRGMVARANGMLQDEEELHVKGISTKAVLSTYPKALVLPDNRHDNDKLDITEISILPTEGEIRSDQPEFLPSTNLDQPHFLSDQAQRHIDTHFRLLRHDIFGELKEALGGLLLAMDNDPSLLEQSKLNNLGNIRAYSYPKTQLRYISFDHRRGLEVQLSFPQPPNVRKRSPSERGNWWKESKRLEEGVLLCFLAREGSKSSLLFLTVSDKICDPKKENGLSSHDYFATTTAKLATKGQGDQETMIRLSCQDTHGLLIELPGVILATFIPILESLQSMYRLNRLPFRQWILPDRLSTMDADSELNIPPPL